LRPSLATWLLLLVAPPVLLAEESVDNKRDSERHYLRMLLMIVKGTQDYEQLRTYNGKLYHTFKEDCNARGLLGNDQEWYDAFNEAAAWGTSSQLRQLFVTMLLFL